MLGHTQQALATPVVLQSVALGPIPTPQCFPPGHPNPVLVNGHFLIRHHPNLMCPTGCVLGDGIDDRISWNFNFSAIDPAGTQALISGGVIYHARLTLHLLPRDPLIITDGIEILGLPAISPPEITGLLYPGGAATVTINLLQPGYYTSSQILERLQAGFGSLHMQYADDAYLMRAELHLDNIPEPASLLLTGSGILAVALCRGYQRRRNRPRQRL